MTSPRVCLLRPPSPPAPRHLQAGLDNKLQPAMAGASLCPGLDPSQALAKNSVPLLGAASRKMLGL